MAIAVRAAALNKATTGTSYTVTKPAGTVSGDVLIAFSISSGTTTNMTSSEFTQTGANSPQRSAKAWILTAGGSEPASYTFGMASGDVSATIVVGFSGVDTITPLDAALVWGGSGTGSTSHVAPAVSPVNAASMLVCGFHGGNVSTTASYTTPASGMTEQGQQTVSTSFPVFLVESLETQLLTASGTTGTRTATFSVTGGAWTAFSLALLPIQPVTFLPQQFMQNPARMLAANY